MDWFITGDEFIPASSFAYRNYAIRVTVDIFRGTFGSRCSRDKNDFKGGSCSLVHLRLFLLPASGIIFLMGTGQYLACASTWDLTLEGVVFFCGLLRTRGMPFLHQQVPMASSYHLRYLKLPSRRFFSQRFWHKADMRGKRKLHNALLRT